MTNPNPQRLLSVPGAAEIFGVHPSTIRRYVSSGRITGYRFGPRMLRVDLDELEAMLEPVPTNDNGGAE